jgi:hypothetical protein
LETLAFEWDSRGAAWKHRLSELAEYRKTYGNCNVPYNYGETTKLHVWVMTQRINYKLHLEGKKSYMTDFRFQELEKLAFE